MKTNKWIVCEKPNPKAKIRLFCFPYLGGGASVFQGWGQILPSYIEVCAVQSPGKEERRREKPIKDKSILIKEFINAILPLTDKPFAFYGHSVGAGISLNLADIFYRYYRIKPIHVFIGAFPHMSSFPDTIFDLFDCTTGENFSEDWACRLLKTLDIPDFLISDKKWLKEIFPTIRADAHIVRSSLEEIQKDPNITQFPYSVTVFAGLKDSVYEKKNILPWEKCYGAKEKVRVIFLNGGHLFISESKSRKVFLNKISNILKG